MGAGGKGISAIKEWATKIGYEFTGSDDSSSGLHQNNELSTNQLNESKSYNKHFNNKKFESMKEEKNKSNWINIPENSTDFEADCIVTTGVIKKTHPQYIHAISKKIPIFHRADFLKQIIPENAISICVSGSHGKTTTSGMITWLLKTAKENPSYALGDKILEVGKLSELNKSKFAVIESDESDGSMQKLSGNWNILTNIDGEHMDYYETQENLNKAFNKFAVNNVISHISCFDKIFSEEKEADKFSHKEKSNAQLNNQLNNMHKINRTLHSYGIDSKEPILKSIKSNIYAENISINKDSMIFDVKGFFTEKSSGDRVYFNIENIMMNNIGKHNIENALSVILLAKNLINEGTYINDSTILKSMKTFPGMSNRMEGYSDSKNTYIMDYAHHPVEIKALLNCIKNREYKNVKIILEIHKYSRLFNNLDSFVKCLEGFENIIVAPIHSAGEIKDKQLDIKFFNMLNNFMKEQFDGSYNLTKVDKYNELEIYLDQTLKAEKDNKKENIRNLHKSGSKTEPNTFIFIGAGEICKFYRKIVDQLKSSSVIS
ncbi:Mur ligase family protein [Candidatus Nesciobacter abundans]|uniref:Mur ligase central domain-containing protein n=1 Tax=Candidatus Nesciobacter abundans TaxID=2601668 RepID=A0A5C0UHB7_9PROT|nr:Mur ligase family protein [Candidatus Nesciobacter abundans]QEK39071.1 hypothetical protein FZC36_01305 [Candidatus Nesciobacter abundans]